MGANQPDASSPVPQIQQQAPSPSAFSFVVPTEFVELPSKGKHYAKGHPLCGQETVEIKHMTAKEEDLLTSRSLLKKGLAINRVLQSILVDKSIDVDSLLIGDKNAIIIATRISAYGADYETQVSCPACMTSTKHSFNLHELEINHGDELDEGVKKEKNYYIITLPKTKVDVKVKLLDGKDERFLADATAMKRKRNLPDATLTDQFRTFIVSVNGHTDQKAINEFVEKMPAFDSRFLRTTYAKAVPNIDMSQDFICNNCDYEAAMEVPLSADFFWPK
jgi:hypothetical protein